MTVVPDFRRFRPGDPEPEVGTSVLADDGSVYTRGELNWRPGPWNWTGITEHHGEVIEVDTIEIQPAMNGDASMPDSYFVHPDFAIGRQDLWKGDPSTLAGFQRYPDVQRIDVFPEEFVAVPTKALGLYPVFARRNGTKFNLDNPIESIVYANGVRVIRDESPVLPADPNGGGLLWDYMDQVLFAARKSDSLDAS